MGRRCQFGWRMLIGWRLARLGLALALITACSPSQLIAADPVTRPADSIVSPELLGRKVEEVRVTGNAQVSSQVVLNQVRTHEGDRFDPKTVEEDYQRIYQLNRFSNVEARVEPTQTGVIVIFAVTEEKLIHSINFFGNRSIDTEDLRKAVDLKVGEAIQQFRIALAERAISALYKNKNHPLAHVDLDQAELTRSGNLNFTIVEGAPVTIRDIEFIGAKSFTTGYFGKLMDVVKTRRYLWVLDNGTYDSDQVDEDVSLLRHFYKSQGFFDVNVGRKLIISPDQTEMEVDFLINEGPRYKIGTVSFAGNKNVSDQILRKNLYLKTGEYFDDEILQHDLHEIVAAYAPLGYVYVPNSVDPDYLRIGKPNYPWIVKTVFHSQPGVVDLVYEISEGKPFHMGRIIIKGNESGQDKLVLRAIHSQPGELYNSGDLEDAVDRLRGEPAFAGATITPVGNAPDTRDVLVEVKDQNTAKVSVGGSVTSNLGLAAQFTFEQRNFDITKVPSHFSDFFSDNKPFTGAGEDFAIEVSPGFQQTNASIRFTEPYLFDQPYSNTDEAHFQQTVREAWYETRSGGSISIGKRFNDNLFSAVSFAAEDVKISGVQDYFPSNESVDIFNPGTHEPQIDPSNGHVDTRLRSARAPDVLEHTGHNMTTNVGWQVRWDDTNHGPLLYQGDSIRFSYDYFGALGGQYHYNQFTTGFDHYQTLYTDALQRRTVLNFHLDAGYIFNDAPFFNRFYGGGPGSVRGFEYRGVGPRAGRDLDPIGGDFNLVGTLGLNYPIIGDNIRGVVFTDFGTVEPDIRIHTIRQSVGAGLRVTIPQLGFTRPLAFDIAFPIFKGPQDIRQVFSFGVGI